jgi:hypothetical protein
VNAIYVSNTLPNGDPFNGIQDQSLQPSILVNVYPNPAGDLFTVEFVSGNFSGPFIIDLLNTQGKELKRFLISGNSKKITLDVSGVPAGFYLLRIMNKENVITKKVLLSR